MSDVADSTNPYAAPKTMALTPPSPVWPWFVLYCAAMASLYLLLAALGLFLIVADQGEEEAALLVGLLFITVALPFFAVYASAPFWPKRPLFWILCAILIGLGLTSCATIPFCVPLMLFWLKPENQAFFGRTPAPPADRAAAIAPAPGAQSEATCPTKPPATNPAAVAAAILGLASVLCLGPILGVPGIVCGVVALRRSHLGGQAAAWVGIASGVVSTLLWAVFVLVAIFA